MRPDIDLRSFLDTRGAAILLTLSLLAVLGFALLGGLIQPSLMPEGTSDVSLTFFFLTLPLSLIIPVITVLMTAGEWSDHSIQNTLLQRPARLAVLTSKVLATAAVFLVLVALSVGLAAATTWIGGELMGQGAVFSTVDEVFTSHLAVLLATLLFSLAMAMVLQSTVLGMVAAIGVPFVVSTAGVIATAFGSELLSDIIRALDLQTAAMVIAGGEGTAFDLLPLLLLVVVPAALGIRRWAVREVG